MARCVPKLKPHASPLAVLPPEGALPPPSALAARRAIKQRVQRKGRAEAPQGGGTAKDKAEAPLVLSDSDSDQEVWM